MLLSPNFSLDELTQTEVRALQEQNRIAAEPFIPVLKRVADELLEPVRALFDAPVVIHSGFRYPVLNSTIGGSPRSQHMVGEAVDFVVVGWDLTNTLHKIMASQIKFRQLLIEGGCLHISLPTEEGPDGEVAYWAAGVKTIIRAGA